MNKLILFIFVIGCLLHQDGFTQDTITVDQNDTISSIGVHMQAERFGDEIIVRWAPVSPVSWSLGNQFGYQLERLIRDPQEPIDVSKFEKITDVLRPLDSLGFYAVYQSDTSNKYVQAMAECIHGKLMVADPNLPGTILQSSDALYNRFAFAMISADFDGEAAKAAGLRFEDDEIEDNKQYYYRITLFGEDNQPISVSGCVVNTAFNENIIPEIKEIKSLDGQVDILWDRTDHQTYFSAYHIERSQDGTNWIQLNEEPYVHAENRMTEGNPNIAFSDSIPNYTPHYYRLRGLTPFGTTSDPSPVVKGMSRDLTPPIGVSEVKAEFFEGDGVEITWSTPDENAEDIDRMIVGHSLYFTGPFLPFAEYDNGQFVESVLHEEPDPYRINYYMVAIVDTAGNIANSLIASAMIPDTEPPIAPQGGIGIVDTNGIVKLTWEQNTEPDMQGYQVYYGGAMRSNFTQITTGPILDTFFIDTLPVKTLTQNVYYKIVAVDQRFNYSEFSKVIKLERPDVLPPSPPVFISYDVRPEGILLSWANSSSLDVVRHELQRKTKTGEWELISQFDQEEDRFTDKDITQETHYQYRLLAFDEKEQWSESKKYLNIRSRAKNLSAPVLQVNQSTDGIVLRWDQPGVDSKMIVQKSVNDGPFITIRQEATSTSYIDAKVREDQKYAYRLQLMEGSKKSPFSNAIEIQL